MIITVPTAQLCIKSKPAVEVRVEQIEYKTPYVIFEENDFVSNVVYADFPRGPPQINKKVA